MNPQIKKAIEELKEELKTSITVGYFIHCKPKDRPDFKTADQAQNWYKEQNFIAEKVIGNWVDNTMVIIESFLITQLEEMERETIKECIKKIDKMRAYPEYRNGRVGDLIIKRDTLLAVKNILEGTLLSQSNNKK
jgi:hypothetical protein